MIKGQVFSWLARPELFRKEVKPRGLLATTGLYRRNEGNESMEQGG